MLIPCNTRHKTRYILWIYRISYMRKNLICVSHQQQLPLEYPPPNWIDRIRKRWVTVGDIALKSNLFFINFIQLNCSICECNWISWTTFFFLVSKTATNRHWISVAICRKGNEFKFTSTQPRLFTKSYGIVAFFRKLLGLYVIIFLWFLYYWFNIYFKIRYFTFYWIISILDNFLFKCYFTKAKSNECGDWNRIQFEIDFYIGKY